MILFTPPDPPRSEAVPEKNKVIPSHVTCSFECPGTFSCVLEKCVSGLEVCPASEVGKSSAVPQIHACSVLSPLSLAPWAGCCLFTVLTRRLTVSAEQGSLCTAWQASRCEVSRVENDCICCRFHVSIFYNGLHLGLQVPT